MRKNKYFQYNSFISKYKLSCIQKSIEKNIKFSQNAKLNKFQSNKYIKIQKKIYNLLMETTLEESREIKQKFLRQQVLQQGYDPDDFVDFLNSVSTKGVDVDLITLQQLMDVVKAFKAKKNETSSKIVTSNIIKKQTKQVIKQPPKPKYINYEKFSEPVQELEFQKKFKCLKVSSKAPKQEGKIQVSDPKRESSGGFFGLGAVSFLLFKITTPQFKWQVRRRYSDFQWLRTIICKFFPTYIIPPIPKKNAAKRTARDLQKRMRILSYFLNDLAALPVIFYSKYVQGFMSITSDSKFEELKDQANKKQVFENITTLQTATGEVTVKLTNQRKIYIEEIQKYINGSEMIYKSITRNSKALQNHIIQQTNILYNMGNEFADLHELINNFNNILPGCKQINLNDSYITLNNLMVEWGNIIKNQHAFIQKNFNTFFRYVRNELYSFRESLAKVKILEQEYFQKKIILDKKKERIFSLVDLTKWQLPNNQYKSIPSSAVKNKNQAWNLMLPKQSLQLEKMKLKYAFYNSQFFENSSQCLQRRATGFCDNFKQFAIKIKVNNQQLTQLWMQIATNFADPKRKALSVNPVSTNEEQIQDG